MTGHTIRFAETQYFRQWWYWLVLGGSTVFVVGSLANGLHVQLIQGEPWGKRPMSDTGLIVTAAFL